MKELWSLEVMMGSKWESRLIRPTMEGLLVQADLLVGRALANGYKARVVPYVIDEERAKDLS